MMLSSRSARHAPVHRRGQPWAGHAATAAVRPAPFGSILHQRQLMSTGVVAMAGKAGKKGGGKEDKEDGAGSGPYSPTVKLPVTSFSLRANATTREPEIQAWWEQQRVYDSLLEANAAAGGGAYTLHDGPPYANGDLHIGHALNKVLKDFINRYQLLRGKAARFVPGWDTHGLPIEMKVLQSLPEAERKGLTPVQLRQKAKEFALKTVEAQKAQFVRYGVWGDWASPYVTLQPAYEAAQLTVFGRMFLKGHIYRGRKPVHWSPSSQTALAEAELEYPEGHTSRSAYVALPLTAPPPGAEALQPPALAAALRDPSGTALAVWTTTPWTLPANQAVAVNGVLTYCVAEASGDAAAGWSHKKIIVAKDLVPALEAKFGVTLNVLGELSGEQLAGAKYRHPLYPGDDSRGAAPVVVGGDYITTDSGTGLVHTAPGHGTEDFLVGQRYGLPVVSPVDDAGVFTAEAGPQFAGLQVQKDGNAAVVAALGGCGALLKEEAYSHKYPYDWRTKKPTIMRATSQWFASVEGFRSDALAAINAVSWVPASGLNRIASMTEGRGDWCISRQRKWGVPIPVFYDKESGEPVLSQETLDHVIGLVRQHGSDCWWTLPLEELLPPGPLREKAASLRKGEDTMDVWFDSGSSWAGVLQANSHTASSAPSTSGSSTTTTTAAAATTAAAGAPAAGATTTTAGGLSYPADLYLEGSDQHRGWFQSSLLTSVAVNGSAPYKAVLTHGFVLDEKGMKMSKSLGNVVDPRLVIEGGKDQKQQPGYGADVLRLWVSSVDYTSDVMIGPGILKQTFEVYRKIRNTLRFLLGSLSDYDPAKHVVPYSQLPSVDRYMLAQLSGLVSEVRTAYDAFQFYRIYQAVQRFAVVDLSAFYLDCAKDRLYIRSTDDAARRSCQTVLHATLLGLLSALAPLVPHTAEDAWQALPSKPPGAPSVFQAGWFAPPTEWAAGLSAEQAASWADVRAVRDGVNTALERARVDRLIGASLEAQVMLHVSGNAKLADTLAALNGAANGVDELRYLLIVSQAQLVAEPAAISSATKYVEKVALPEGRGEVTVGVAAAAGRKCARCWNYSADVGSADAAEHPELCGRCVPVVRQLGFKPIVVPPAAASTATDDAAAAAKKTPAPASTAAA